MKQKILYTLLLYVFAGNYGHAQNRSDFSPVIIPSTGMKVSPTLPLDAVNLLDARLENTTLVLQVQYGGGCRDHIFSLFTHPMFFSNDYGTIPIFVSHEANGDNCKALVAEEISFPLNQLIQKVSSIAGPEAFELRFYAPRSSSPFKRTIRIESK